MKVALLGIGLMGKPMVKNLAAAGHDVHIWNRTAEKANALSEIARVHDSPASAAAASECTICMLYDGVVTSDVLLKQNALQACPDDALIINMGSVEPDRDRKLAEKAESDGKQYLDAPVSGGVKGAEEASLSIFVGGRQEVMQKALSVLEVLGNPHYMGPSGAGQSAKLANQLIVAITIGAVAEAFKLAESAGCDLAVLQRALQGGFADSRILKQHGMRMVSGDYEPGGRSSSQLKDIVNAQQLAAKSHLELPLSDTVEQGFRSLVDDYNGADMDHAAYFYWLQQKHA